MKVAIYGVGALGARLAAVGCEVSVIARDATLAVLQQHGLRIKRTARQRACRSRYRTTRQPLAFRMS